MRKDRGGRHGRLGFAGDLPARGLRRRRLAEPRPRSLHLPTRRVFMCCSGESAMTKSFLKNRTFDEIKIGDAASLTRLVSADDVQLFAAVSGDVNPTHFDAKYAAHDAFGHIIIHGMWIGSLISAVLGTELPGPGTIYLDQDLHFLKSVAPGDSVTATVTVREKRPDRRIVLLDTICENQRGEAV